MQDVCSLESELNEWFFFCLEEDEPKTDASDATDVIRQIQTKSIFSL